MNARRMFDALVQKRGVALKPKLEINEIHTRGEHRNFREGNGWYIGIAG